MAHINRKANDDNKRGLINDAVFSMEEIEDVLELIVSKQWPDIKFSDNECCLWGLIMRKLNIDFPE